MAPVLYSSQTKWDEYLQMKQVPHPLISEFFKNHSHSHKTMLHLSGTCGVFCIWSRTLPFGISLSPTIWQRFMEQVRSGMDSICVMLDDVLVTGKTNDEHLCNLEEVFLRFQWHGLRLKEDKCAFLQPSVTYYGLHISKQGVKLTEERIKALRKAPQRCRIALFFGLSSSIKQFYSKLVRTNTPLE